MKQVNTMIYSKDHQYLHRVHLWLHQCPTPIDVGKNISCHMLRRLLYQPHSHALVIATSPVEASANPSLTETSPERQKIVNTAPAATITTTATATRAPDFASIDYQRHVSHQL
ncbi:hypothetical protein ACFX2J_045964 [Malus domestica]